MKGFITVPRVLLGLGCLLPICSVLAADLPTAREPGNVYYRWVDVVDVQPLHSLERVSVPTEYCVEPDRHPAYVNGRPYRRQYDDEHYNDPGSGFGSLLGGLIGGLIGNQFGGGKGKTAMTVAGAITGAAIAGSVRRARAVEAGACHIEYEQRTTQRVREYDVTYLIDGHEYHKRTSTHPGDRIRIRLEVTPEVTSRPASSDSVQVSFIPVNLPLPDFRERYQYV